MLYYTLIYTNVYTGQEEGRAVVTSEPDMEHINECATFGIAVTIVS